MMDSIIWQLSDISAADEDNKTDYISLLKHYDQVGDNAVLIYYEDLITEPKKTLMDVANFIDIPDGEMKVNDYIDNIDAHIEKSLKICGNNSSAPITKGDATKLIHHSKILSDAEKRKIDQHLQDNFNPLFEKYLLRYKE